MKLAAAMPALVVTLPLVGHSVLGDDRRRLYRAARQVGSSPLEAVEKSLHSVGGFLDRGTSARLAVLWRTLSVRWCSMLARRLVFRRML